MSSQMDLEKAIQKTVILYNKMKSPEAFSKILTITPYAITISFSGSFCYSCGVLKYIEEFMRDFNIFSKEYELEAGKTRETSPRSFEVDYLVKRK